MNFRLLFATTALSIAGLLTAGPAAALPLSGCTPNGGVQTCNLYESDPNGSPSEVSSANNFFGTDWDPGYVEVFDPTPATAPILSDVVVFTGGTATLYSFDNGAPASFPGFDSIGVLLGTATEDASGFATFGKSFGDCCDTINVFSPTVPEPVTLSIFGVGLAAAIAVRRRRNTGRSPTSGTRVS